jgi:RNA polymerase-binding transcription factor DksA
MYKATKSRRRRAGETLSRGQLLALRDQLRDELAWLKRHLQKSTPVVFTEDFAQRTARVVAALDRIRKGTYGCCAVCGEPIPFERLECVPETTRCVTCRAAGFSPSEHR